MKIRDALMVAAMAAALLALPSTSPAEPAPEPGAKSAAPAKKSAPAKKKKPAAVPMGIGADLIGAKPGSIRPFGDKAALKMPRGLDANQDGCISPDEHKAYKARHPGSDVAYFASMKPCPYGRDAGGSPAGAKSGMVDTPATRARLGIGKAPKQKAAPDAPAPIAPPPKP